MALLKAAVEIARPSWRRPIAIVLPRNQQAHEALRLRENRFIVRKLGVAMIAGNEQQTENPVFVEVGFGILAGRRYISIGCSCRAEIRIPKEGDLVNDLHAYIKVDYKTGCCTLTDASEKGTWARVDGTDESFLRIHRASIRIDRKTTVRIGSLEVLIRPTILYHTHSSLTRLQDEHNVSLTRRQRRLSWV